MRWLRYYAPTYDRNEHFEILTLLEEIRKRYGIEYEIIPVKKRDWYDKEPIMSEEEVYEKHLKPQTKVIKENVGESSAKIFKSRSGNIYVAGTIAVIEDGHVIWAYPFKQTEFLRKVLDDPEIIYKFKSGRRGEIKNVHDKIFEALMERNLPEPKIHREEKIYIREVATGFKIIGISWKDIRDIIEKSYWLLKEEDIHKINIFERSAKK